MSYCAVVLSSKQMVTGEALLDCELDTFQAESDIVFKSCSHVQV